MNKKIIAFLIIIIAVILAYYTAGYFGYVYDLFPKTTNGAWIGSKGSWDFLSGFPLSLIFFLSLFSYRFVFNSKRAVLWLLSPILLFEIAADLAHIYAPVILIMSAFALNKILSLVISKFHHPNPPMVIK